MNLIDFSDIASASLVLFIFAMVIYLTRDM